MMKEAFISRVRSTKLSFKQTGFFGVKVRVNEEHTRFTFYSDAVCPKCQRPLDNQDIIVEFFKPQQLSIFQAEMLYAVFSLNKLPMDYAQYHKCQAGQEFIANIKSITANGENLTLEIQHDVNNVPFVDTSDETKKFNEEIDYEKQAQDFLNQTGTIFKTEFLRNGKMWDDLSGTRDIFEIWLKRGDKQWFFEFGQSIAESDGKGSNAPTPYDVLASITKSDPGTFDEFCSEFWYNVDSISAKKTYDAVVKEWNNVIRMFTPEEREILQGIQ